MRYLLLVTLALLLNEISAQPKFQYYYSIFDSCPVTQNHIASRTITVTDSITGLFMTRTEQYDKHGKITRVDDVEYGAQWADGDCKTTTIFRYDNEQRISELDYVCDSLPWMKITHSQTQYTYDTISRCIKRYDEGLGFPTVTASYYNEQNEFYAFTLIGPNGDTSQRTRVFRDTTIALNYFPDQNGKTYLHDSSFLINSAAYTNYYYWSIDRPSGRIVKHYNTAHQLTDEVNFTNEVLTDSTHNTYSKGKRSRLTETTRIRFPNEHLWFDTLQVTWHSQYTYDKKGNLTEVKTVSDNPKDNIWITRYTYDEKGLRIRKVEVKVVDGKEKMWKEEKWGYTYY